ncbi:ITB7 protein, partial [Amia calva]|nr:ITB7 protein [Amia calva]
CKPKSSCNECIRTPHCAWCSKVDFLQPGEGQSRRCGSVEALKGRGCTQDKIQSPREGMKLLKNQPINSGQKGDTVVQLRPQSLNLQLRLGVPLQFQVTFRRAEGYPIDLYYLMDLSYSMNDDLQNIKNLGQEILSALTSVTKRGFRCWFGSFVDKVALPYVSTVRSKLKNPCPNRLTFCQPAFSFRNVLPLTNDAAEFQRRVSQQNISGNLDSPEAGFDAMMQAAVCQEEIGWRNVTRILVYTSDDTFHTAGDGKLAGIYLPSDGRCHLDAGEYKRSTDYDYPSVGHLSQILSSHNIQLIFAVTDKSVPSYRALSQLIPQSVVGELKEDSSNVVQLISDAYKSLSSTIYLESQGAPHGLDITYDSHCGGGRSLLGQQRGECTNITIDQEISFMVTVSSSACLSGQHKFFIKPQGFSEQLQVTVEMQCDCNCQDLQPRHEFCNGNGTLNCGVCSCDQGHQGRKLYASCRETNTSQLCSGRGDCVCGQCVCRGVDVRGTYCDCDDSTCNRDNNLICGGHGRCDCGKCVCEPGYSGAACECPDAQTECKGPDGKLCSGQGQCQCNRCQCKQGYYGQYCGYCRHCDPCLTHRECVKCHGTLKDSSDQNCSALCGETLVKRVPSVPGSLCRVEGFVFSTQEKDNAVHIQYAEAPNVIDTTTMIVGSSVSSIIFIGLILIIVYRILLELYDRREYQHFIRDQKNMKWKETQNPLFRDATTTTVNPMFNDS